MCGVIEKDSPPAPYPILDLTEGGYTPGIKMLVKKEKAE